ncbi:MAG: SDR family oxidoreductase [Archangium sp.]
MKKPFAGEPLQDAPGSQAAMKHQPDCGETSYEGRGRLEGKTAIITGGDSGIGRAVAIAYAREGARVGILYWNEDEDVRSLERVFEQDGKQLFSVRADLADARASVSAVKSLVETLGGHLDVLVNNAGVQGKAVERFEDIDDERLERTFAVNIVAMFRMVRAVLPNMKSGASIINVASIQAFQPKAQILDYATTKGAIVTFTRGLAQEFIQRGIRVNAVAPGPVWTPLIVQSFDKEKVESFGADNPSGRAAQPVELAAAFVLLASDEESSFINGEVIGVTGGKPTG